VGWLHGGGVAITTGFITTGLTTTGLTKSKIRE
jgi:uncharacterized membrane protein YccC